jgi:hypothetical protein
MKNICGARVGDIWRLGTDGHSYILLELKTRESTTLFFNSNEDTFLAVCLDSGTYDEVYFSHYNRMGWEKVA